MNALLRITGIIPFLCAIFLNTVVDLGHKIVIQNTIFKMYDASEQIYLTAIINALVLLPFILMFSLSGFVSDKYAKHRVMQTAAWVAVILTTCITLCYSMGWFWLAFSMTFLLAIQSAFYSPAKYSYIKSIFGQQNLATGNGWVQAVSIIGILLGTVLFSILFESLYPPHSVDKNDAIKAFTYIGYILVGTSVLELIMMYRLPHFTPNKTSQQFRPLDYLKGNMAKNNLKPVFNNRHIFLSIIGLSIFWSIGQVMLAAFPAFAKAQTGETNTIIIQATMAASGIGIAVGSIIAARFSKNYIETGLIPVGALGVSVGLAILPFLHSHLLMAIDFLFIGLMAGIFIVPLNAIIQFYAKDNHIGRTLAASNFIQNIFMLSFLLLTVIFAILGIDSKHLLLFIALIAFTGFSYTIYQLPQSLVRFIFSRLISSRYKTTVLGMKNIPASGGVLLLGNHISWIDWAIIQIASPRPIRFVMIKDIYERWYLKWFFDLFGCIPIKAGPGSHQSFKEIAQRLNQGEVVCLFPEGAISKNGQLSEFKRGFEKAAQAADSSVIILPFYIQGLWGSQFSLSNASLTRLPSSGLRRELLVAFGKPLNKSSTAHEVKQQVFDLSMQAWTSYTRSLPTLPEAWIDTVKQSKLNPWILDTLGKAISGTVALASSIALSHHIKKISPENTIGLLLPTSAGGMITNMSALLLDKTVVNINYTSSKDSIYSAIQQSNIKTIYSSRRFIAKLTARGIDLSSLFNEVDIIYIEDIYSSIKKIYIIGFTALIKLLPSYLLKKLFCNATDNQKTAAILFSSGSEGAPKGIELSHHNIMANIKQISEVLNTEKDDIVMASLPLFHAFGLTATQFMPLIQGLPVVCHPDPTDSANIGKAVARNKATILFGTSTFLRLYTRDHKIKPLMFNSLRLVIAGAEKLNSNVRENFRLKFGKIIYEGYGATETAPVTSVNLPDQINTDNWKIHQANKPNTVGMPLPGTHVKIVDPESFRELPNNTDGMILIGGPQVMKGYLNNPNKNAQAIKMINDTRWYVSGDKGHVDTDGFLIITDRYSRFAKIGGEMVSLSVVENAVKNSLNEESIGIMAMNMPDTKKGEKIILLAEKTIDIYTLKASMIEKKCNPLLIPSEVLFINELPVLGSGKSDFSAAKEYIINNI